MNKAFNKNLSFIILCLGILAFFMILLPSLGTNEGDSTFTGLQITFGHEFANIGTWVSGQIQFGLFGLIAYLLPLIACAVLFIKQKNYLISSILFGLAIIMLFLIPNFTVVTIDILGNINEIDVNWTYQIGLIGAMVLSFVSLLFSLYGFVQSK